MTERERPDPGPGEMSREAMTSDRCPAVEEGSREGHPKGPAKALPTGKVGWDVTQRRGGAGEAIAKAQPKLRQCGKVDHDARREEGHREDSAEALPARKQWKKGHREDSAKALSTRKQGKEGSSRELSRSLAHTESEWHDEGDDSSSLLVREARTSSIAQVLRPDIQVLPEWSPKEPARSSLRGSAEASPTTERCARVMRVWPVPVCRQASAVDTGLTGADLSVGQGRHSSTLRASVEGKVQLQ